MDIYAAHDIKSAIYKKRSRRKRSEFADMHKRGLISGQYTATVYKRK